MTPLSDAAADLPAEPALFTGLVDDAAVFPPGLAPLPDAVREHRVHRTAWYAALIGPLLVPASAAGELASLVDRDGDPLRVVLVARPGTALHVVTDAVHDLREHPGVDVVAAELGWTPEWRDLDLGDLPLTLEVPRGTDQARALDDLALDADDEGMLQAKFRTGATPQWAWPDERELAAFVRGAVDRALAFKLTGGLHHAVRGLHPSSGSAGEEQHGLLNVLCAVRDAVHGAEVSALEAVLAERDPAPLVSRVDDLDRAESAAVRAFFTAYGCCGVTDPVRELHDLNLIEER
jgi:hypothetical protein